MKIKCTNCGHTEKTDKDFFVKMIGSAAPIGGFWAWTSYLFAGTGFAMVIVVAIIGGGVAMLIFKDEIVEWIINKDYKCPKCGKVEWKTDEGEILELVAEQKSPTIELQKRIAIVEDLLHSKGYEFETTGVDWIILESSGDLKQINSIDELEQYAISL